MSLRRKRLKIAVNLVPRARKLNPLQHESTEISEKLNDPDYNKINRNNPKKKKDTSCKLNLRSLEGKAYLKDSKSTVKNIKKDPISANILVQDNKLSTNVQHLPTLVQNHGVVNNIKTDTELSIDQSRLKHRQRIRATPCLGIRRSSVQGHSSDIEDEPKRSTNSSETQKNLKGSYKDLTNSHLSDIPINQEQNLKGYRKDIAIARKIFEKKFNGKTPKRTDLKMLDLVYYNPIGNPMTKSINTETTVKIAINEASEQAKNPEMTIEKGIEDDSLVPVPKLKLGPNDEIILDEKSLVIETSEQKRARAALAKSSVIYLDGENTTGFYKRKTRRKGWSDYETMCFYKCLQRIGTDFSLMHSLFPKRSRRELKSKFKREEKINKPLIMKALETQYEFDLNELKKEIEADDDLLRMEEIEQERKNQKAKKKIKPSSNTEIRKSCRSYKKKARKKSDLIEIVKNESCENFTPAKSSDSLSDNCKTSDIVGNRKIRNSCTKTTKLKTKPIDIRKKDNFKGTVLISLADSVQENFKGTKIVGDHKINHSHTKKAKANPKPIVKNDNYKILPNVRNNKTSRCYARKSKKKFEPNDLVNCDKCGRFELNQVNPAFENSKDLSIINNCNAPICTRKSKATPEPIQDINLYSQATNNDLNSTNFQINITDQEDFDFDNFSTQKESEDILQILERNTLSPISIISSNTNKEYSSQENYESDICEEIMKELENEEYMNSEKNYSHNAKGKEESSKANDLQKLESTNYIYTEDNNSDNVKENELNSINELKDILEDSKQGCLAIVTCADINDPNKIVYKVYRLCKDTGKLSDKPLVLPDEVTNILIKEAST